MKPDLSREGEDGIRRELIPITVKIICQAHFQPAGAGDKQNVLYLSRLITAFVNTLRGLLFELLVLFLVFCSDCFGITVVQHFGWGRLQTQINNLNRSENTSVQCV
ncbi:hypothetical protein Mapa_006724 [Marchantia paleacea]|nr:hypothetical protein Mapa_006724 [Marchantia paleacea]